MQAASYVLPEALDLAFVASVHRDLLKLRGADLDVDASGVRKVSGLGVQLLLAASTSWEVDGRRFRVLGRSTVMNDALRLTGSFLPGDKE